MALQTAIVTIKGGLTLSNTVSGITYDATSGELTVTLGDGTTQTHSIGGKNVASVGANGTMLEITLTDGSVHSVDLASIIPAEQGGLEWNSSLTYEEGSIVSFGHDLFVAAKITSAPTTAGISEWISLKPKDEKGGVSWDAGKSYIIGDTAVYADVLYIATQKSVGANPSASVNSAPWLSTVSKACVAGKAWNNTNTYDTGDVVSDGDKLYVSLVASNSTQPKAASTNEWHLIDFPIKTSAGGAFNPLYDYKIGDITSTRSPTGGLDRVYVCTVAGVQGTFNPGNWNRVDRGGVLWSIKDNYAKGDLVVRNDKIYIANGPSTGSDPINLADWFEFSVPRSLAGTFTPSLGAEYPNVANASEGDVITIVGLTNPHTMAGGVLAGVAIDNNDKLIYHSSAPNWTHEPFPKIDAEFGGIAYNSSSAYPEGAIVTYGDELYRSGAVIKSGQAHPGTNGSLWVKLNTSFKVAPKYDPSVAYNTGEVVVFKDPITHIWKMFLTPIGTTAGDEPYGPAHDWVQIGDGTVGGSEYDPSIIYAVGDVVSLTSSTVPQIVNLYSCLIPGSGLDINNPTNWKNVTEGFVEKGGVPWTKTPSYKPGDLVTHSGSIWVANAASTNTAPGAFVPGVISPWTLLNPLERGGVIWDTGDSYSIGDVVSDNINGNIYIAIADNSGMQPSMTPADWKLSGDGVPHSHNPLLSYPKDSFVIVGGDMFIAPAPIGTGPFDASQWIAATNEGDEWVGNVNYEVGDITSLGGVVYVATLDNRNLSPAVSPNNWRIVTSTSVFDPIRPYFDGDIVAHNGKLFIAPAGGIGAGVIPTVPATPGEWILATPSERGGVKWVATTTYIAGDTATEGPDDLQWMALAPVVGSAPSAAVAGEWKQLPALDFKSKYTAPQVSVLDVSNSGSFDLDKGQVFKCTPTGATTITFSNLAGSAGQMGNILLDNSTGKAITIGANTVASADMAGDLSGSAKFIIGYVCDGTSVYLSYSSELA